jgi:hypothetical protein
MQMVKHLVGLPVRVLLVGMGGSADRVLRERAVRATPRRTTVVVADPKQRVLTHLKGRYKLHDDGTTSSLYTWV